MMCFATKWVLISAVIASCVAGCLPGDRISGPVQFGRIGALPSGETFVEFDQPYQKGISDENGVYFRAVYNIVGLNGIVRRIDNIPTMLAADCNDNPVELAPCVPAMVVTTGGANTWRFVMNDGSVVTFDPSQDIASRTAMNGAELWTVVTDANPVDALRSDSITIVTKTAISRINAVDGSGEWTVPLPPTL